MPDITLTVDFTQVNSLNTTLKSTDTIFVKVVDSLFRESKRADRVTKAFADTTQKNLDIINKAEAVVSAKLQQESDKREKARTREASRAEKEAQRIVAANDKIAKAEAKLAAEVARNQAAAAQRSTTALNDRLGVTGTPATGGGAGFATLDNEIERLRLKYDQIYASSQLYERSLAELNTAHRLGAISTKGHESAVESLNQEYQNFQNGIRQVGNRFVQHSNQTSDGMSRMGVAAQQTGYQFSDFIVQVQGGTNPLVAFSQQMTQMAGLLYLLPPAVQAARVSFVLFSISMTTAFAAVTILIPLLAGLAMAFANSGKESDKTSKSIDTQTQAYDNLLSKLADLRLARQMEASGIATEEEQKVQNVINALLEKRTALQEKINNLKAIGGRTAGYTEQQEAEKALLQIEIDKNEQLLKTFGYLQQVEAAERRRANEVRNLYRQQKADADAQLVVTENQRNADRARAQERLAAQNAERDRTKALDQLVSAGTADAEKRLDIQREYQLFLLDGVESTKAMAQAQNVVERSLLQAAIASGTLSSEQLLAAEASLAILEANREIEEKIQRIVDRTKLLEQGLSLSVIQAMNLAGVDFTKLSDAALAAGVLATNLGISFGLASEIGKISAMPESDRKIYTGVKSGLLPEAALNSIGLGPTGFTREGSFPINMPGMMPDNPEDPKKGSSKKDTQTAIEKLREQLALELALVGTSEAYQKVRSALGEDFKTTSLKVVAGLVQEATETQRLIDLENQRIKIMDTVKSSMEDTLMSIVDGTKSAKEAFKTMAAEIIKELYRVLVVQQLVNSVSGFIMPSKGHSPSMAPPRAPGRAAGGSMMANMAYMVGENGPELVIPRHSGTVVNAKQTANTMNGGGNFTQNLSINVTGSDAAMVRTEVAKMIPQITNATKAAVLDAKQRGGQFAAAFR